MKQSIECEIERTEGSLVRLLGTIERRGFAVESLQVRPYGRDGLLAGMQLQAERELQPLLRQLEKLVDVRSARAVDDGVCEAPAELPSLQGFRASWLAG